MILKQIKNLKRQRLSKFIYDELKINYNQIQKLIRNKDIKINGKRINCDLELLGNEEVEVFLPKLQIEVVFENDDLIVVFKPRNLETVNIENDDLKTILEKQIGIEIFAVHRLDRNTQGLVIFAKNEKAKESLDSAIKNRNIEKYYLALVIGKPEKKSDEMVAYLKKDESISQVYISDSKQQGYELIQTNYKLLKASDEFSLLKVELVTGKTHQIRAHLSHIGLPILGDEKYGNAKINKYNKKKYQCLCAYKLVFHFKESDYLSYMNDKIIEYNKNKIDFCKNL